MKVNKKLEEMEEKEHRTDRFRTDRLPTKYDVIIKEAREHLERAGMAAEDIEIAESIRQEEDEYHMKMEIRASLYYLNRIRERAQKTQAEIDKLKKETRALIKEMQAA